MMDTDAEIFEDVTVLLETTDALPQINTSSKTAQVEKPEKLAVADELAISELVQLLTEVPGSSIVKCETPSPKPKTRAEKEATRKRKYHQRLKNEHESLRQQVDELSEQLHELQQRKDKENASVIDTNWRDVALRERLQRQRVESEQIQLFTAAKMQAMHIGTLCEQLPGKTTRPMVEATTAPLFDESRYRVLVQRVNACYAQVDDVLREFELQTTGDGVTTSMHYREKNGEVAYFQHLNRFTEPYNYVQTHQTMWKLTKLRHRQQGRQDFEGLGSSDDTDAIRFRLKRVLTSRAKVSVLQQCVHRRFVDENRTVFVWKTLSEGEDVFTGMQSEETGWVCLQPSDEDGSTLVRVCVRQAPMRFSVSGSGDSITSEFHQVLQSSIGEDMLEISTALDRMLLDDTLEGIDI